MGLTDGQGVLENEGILAAYHHVVLDRHWGEMRDGVVPVGK